LTQVLDLTGELLRMSTARSIAFWLFIWFAFTICLSTFLVAAGLSPKYPVFETFSASPFVWRLAFSASGVLAALTALLLRKSNIYAATTSLIFLCLYVPSFRFVWGQISFGIYISVIATTLAIYVALKARREV
ncbi:hypothetical protein, partial [Solilutibacter silvestris]|uniref:hypothetical protein n=1 Tax=Solilutibacter silvestris TaxID=1645665 RepID=UPI003D352BBE